MEAENRADPAASVPAGATDGRLKVAADRGLGGRSAADEEDWLK